MMRKLLQIVASLCFTLLLTKTVWGQSSSDNKTENVPIIACQFSFFQSVRFNVVTKKNQELTDLLHTDILIYENGKLQELYSFKVTDDNDLKRIGFRYTVSYTPENQKEDGKYHSIKIIAKTKTGKRIRAQLSINGYYARKGYFDF